MQNQNDDSASSSINVSSVYQNIHSILHFVDRSDPTGPYPFNPASDDAYDNWEYGVQKWNQKTFGAFLGVTSSTTEADLDVTEVDTDE
jgi:hypothetical protein